MVLFLHSIRGSVFMKREGGGGDAVLKDERYAVRNIKEMKDNGQQK